MRSGELLSSGNLVDPQWSPNLDTNGLTLIVNNGMLLPGDGVGPEDLELTKSLQVGLPPTGQNLVPLRPVGLLGVNKATSKPEGNGCTGFLPTDANEKFAIEALDPAAVELVSEDARTIAVQSAPDRSLTSISSAKDLAVPPGTSELVLARKGTILVLTLRDFEPIMMCGLESP